MNSMYKYLYPLLAVVIIIALGISVFAFVQNSQQTPQDPMDDQTGGTPSQNIEPTLRSYTIDEVAVGNTLDNCLMAYRGEVFLIAPSYFDEHPAGPNSILNTCGTDVTDVFDRVHTGNEAVILLADYKVGTLVEASAEATIFPVSEVTAANSLQNCLIIFGGNVYRIPSSWANQHPGGSQNIIDACGRDVTTEFTTAHGSSQAARTQLDEFYVGELER